MSASMSLDAFNNTLLAFIDQLQVLFKKDAALSSNLKNGRDAISIMVNSKPTKRQPLTMFVEAVTPYVQQIKERDDEFFIEHLGDIPFLQGLESLPKLWRDGKISSDNKDAIWQYLNVLCMVGVTIHTLPPETMDAVEEIAKTITQDGAPDAMENVAGLMGGGGFNPMALMGMMGMKK